MRGKSKRVALLGAAVIVVAAGFLLRSWWNAGQGDSEAEGVPSLSNAAPASMPLSDQPPSGTRSTSPASRFETSEGQYKHAEAWEDLLRQDPDPDSVLQFLNSLDSRGLLDLMEYLCGAGQFGVVEALVAPCLSGKWGDEVPFELLLSLAQDKEKDVRFRKVLADIACGARDKSTLEDRDLIALHLMSLALDSTEEAGFRELLIKKLSAVMQMGVSEAESSCDTFLALLQDTSESPRVRGASITALRRLEDERAIPILTDVCLDYSVEDDPYLVRHAVVAVGKYASNGKMEGAADVIGHVIATSKDERVYGSAVYSSSLLESRDFLRLLPDLVDSMEQHLSHAVADSVESALGKHEAAIIDALEHSDERYVVAGIEACTVVPVPEARLKLEALATKLPDSGTLIARAIETANALSADEPDWKQQLKREKAEDD